MFFKFEKKHDTDEMSQTKKKAVEHGYEIKRIYIIYIHFFLNAILIFMNKMACLCKSRTVLFRVHMIRPTW